MKFHQIRLALLAASCFGMLSCSKNNNETVTTQQQRNWLGTDQAAMDSAKPEPEANIQPGTYLAAGRLHEMQGAMPKAMEQYQLALAGDPKNVGAMNRLAMVYTRLGRFDDAQRSLERAVELKPDSVMLRNNLGYAYVCTKNWPAAEEQFRAALRLDPGFHRARINLGMAVAQERISEALAEFRTALPEADALYNLGLVLRGMQRYQQAADAFQLVLARDSQFVAAQRQLDQLAPRLKAGASRNPADAPVVLTTGSTTADQPLVPVATVVPATQTPPPAAPVRSAPTDEPNFADANTNPTADETAFASAAEQPLATGEVAQAVAVVADPAPTRVEPAVAVREWIVPANAPAKPVVVQDNAASVAVATAVTSEPVAAQPIAKNQTMEAAVPVATAVAVTEPAPADQAAEPAVAISSDIPGDVAPLVATLKDEAKLAAADGLSVNINAQRSAAQPVRVAPAAQSPRVSGAPASENEVIVDTGFADAYEIEGVDPHPRPVAKTQVVNDAVADATAVPANAAAGTFLLASSRRTPTDSSAGQVPASASTAGAAAVPAAISVVSPESAEPDDLLPVDDSAYLHFLIEGTEAGLR